MHRSVHDSKVEVNSLEQRVEITVCYLVEEVSYRNFYSPQVETWWYGNIIVNATYK